MGNLRVNSIQKREYNFWKPNVVFNEWMIDLRLLSPDTCRAVVDEDKASSFKEKRCANCCGAEKMLQISNRSGFSEINKIIILFRLFGWEIGYSQLSIIHLSTQKTHIFILL